MKKTVLITGAGTGIGKDTAIALATKGHNVIATTETEDQAQALRTEMMAKAIEMRIFKLDITLSEDRQKVNEFDLDVLINNGAIGESGPLSEIDMKKVRQSFEVNLFGTLELSQLALAKMIEKNNGTVLFVSSLAGRIVMPFMGPYIMTKFALSSGAEAMRNEIRRVNRNVHVSLIEPGAYLTGFNQRMVAKKYVWMKNDSAYYSIIDKLKTEETRNFRLTELKSTKSIVRKIVRATESKRPKLRYSAPGWQAVGVHILRMFGK